MLMYLRPFLTIPRCNNETKAGISPSSCSAHILPDERSRPSR